MRCPFCGHDDTQVKDSRPSEDNSAIRRRRYCPHCDQRFTTFERVQLREMTVVKGGGRKQPFDRDKIIRSMQIALRKRPIDLDAIERATNKIVRKLESEGEAEITSQKIGSYVMEELINLSAFKTTVYYDDTYIIDIEKKIREKIEKIEDVTPIAG